MPDQSSYKIVYQKILTAHRRFFFRRILTDTFYFLSRFILLFAILVFLNFMFDVHTIVRQVLLLALLSWFIVYTLNKIYPSLKEIMIPSEKEIYKTAERVGQRDQQVVDKIVNYLQIYQQKEDLTSPVLKRLALEQLYVKIRDFSIKDKEKKLGVFHQLRAGIAGILIFLIVYYFFPIQLNLALKKSIVPWKTFKESIPIKIHNLSGNMTVLKNDPVELNGRFRGIQPERIFLVMRSGQDENPEESAGNFERIALPVNPSGKFHYRIEKVRNPFSYHFEATIHRTRFRQRTTHSEKGSIEVKSRPTIRNLQIKVTPPSYSRLPSQILEPNQGEITALKGSQVGVNLECDKQLSQAAIVFSDSVVLPLMVAGHTAKGNFPIGKNVNYHFRIQDTDSIGNGGPVEYSVFVLSDAYPFAEFKQPGADVDLGDELVVPLLLEIRDDFGFSSVWLKGTIYRQGSTQDSSNFKTKLPFELIERGRAFSESSWDLTGFYLVPDDYIQYYAEVSDNDRVSGPKSFKTKTYTIRLPSLMEILAESTENQERQLDEIKDIARESEKWKRDLEQINRELKKETEMDWEKEQEIKKQAEKQKELSERLKQVQENFQDMVQEMDQKKVLSPETLEKYFELQQMFRDLDSPELREAMKKLNEAMEKADLNQIKQAMNKLQFSVEEFERNIDRLYELFNRVKLEQQMDELIKLAEKISQDQEKVNRKLDDDSLSAGDFQRLENMEENIGEDFEYLAEKMGLTGKEYQKLMRESSEMLDKAGQYLRDEKIIDKIAQMRESLAQQNRQDAVGTGQQVKMNMEMLQSMLQTAKQQMTMEQKQQLAEQMQRTLRDMLNASFEQERLGDQTGNLSPASPRLNDIAAEQARLSSNANQLIAQILDIANKTFLLSPQLNREMSEVMKNIQQAISSLENRNTQRASLHQKRAMAGFNNALLSLQNSMDQMSQASSASGFQEMMQQLQKLSGQQGQLNQESMMWFKQGQSGRRELSTEDMARLAAQQEMIKESLEKLSGEMGSRRDVLGRLDDLGREMEEIVQELKNERLNRTVIERQQRILSRLLDAQKSIREKEFSRKRVAEREEPAIRKSPPQLREELMRKEDLLRKHLLEALDEGYVLEYKELIKKYFESLARQPEVIE